MKDKDSKLIFEAYAVKSENYLRDVLGMEPEDFEHDDPDQAAMDRKDLHGPSQGHAFDEWQYMVVDTLGADEPLQDGDRSLGRSAYEHVKQLASEIQGFSDIAAKRDKIESWAKEIVDSGGSGGQMPFTDDQKIKLNKFLERFLTKVHMIADVNGDEAVENELWTFRTAVDDLEDKTADERYDVVHRSYRDQREDDKGEPKRPWDKQQKEYDAMDIDDPNHWQNSGAMPPGY